MVDLLCVEPGPYRKDQEAYTGHWRGQLLWRFIRDPILSVTNMMSPFPPPGNEGYIHNQYIISYMYS